MTRACPVCGRVLERSCYHDGQDIAAREMDEEEAREIRRREGTTYTDPIDARDELLAAVLDHWQAKYTGRPASGEHEVKIDPIDAKLYRVSKRPARRNREPMNQEKFIALIHYIGQRPLRSGRVGLAIILRTADFRAYALTGKPITGARYLAVETPGKPVVPRGLFAAIREGWRWGAVEHRLLGGHLTRADAEWIADRWKAGVPT
jgi:hypothetical protein